MQNSYTDNLRQIMREAADFSVVCEIYPSSATPQFNPVNAVKCYAMVEGVEFFGQIYERYIRNIGTVKRTISAETNSASVDFDNLDRAISAFELADTGFEGLIKVIRLISRSQSNLLSDSLILFAGRCDKPKSGTKEKMSVSAKHILGGVGIKGATEVEMPRRKFSPEDLEGRHASDPLFEGFRFQVQYGTISYSVKERRGGLLGMLGFKKTVTKTLQYSSYSDIDASKFLPECFGRVQVIGTHLAYKDGGTYINMTTAFCEGEVAEIVARIVTPPFSFDGGVTYRQGKLGGVDNQLPLDPVAYPNYPGNGYYSRTALAFSSARGTELLTVDAAPDIAAVILGKMMAIPNADGDWQDYGWSDDAAAQTRFVLTSPDYYRLDEAWLDDESFLEVFKFNNEIIFDSSYSDTLFVPNGFASTDYGAAALNLFFRSTAVCSPEYFAYLNKDKSLTETFLLPPKLEEYDASDLIPIEPGDPENPGPPGPGNPIPTANLFFFLRRRFVSNVVVTEQIKAIDFLHNVLFPASRMYFSQAADGRLKLNSKKPVDFALGTAALSGSTIALDDVSVWIANKTGHVLIDPHTAHSEVRTVTAANYSLSQNAVEISASSNIDVRTFAENPTNENDTPAEARLIAEEVAEENFVELDGIEIAFIANEADTIETIAGFIYGAINGHPRLRRKFVAVWEPGSGTVYIRAKFGFLELNSDLTMTHAAPLTNPATAVELGDIGGGTIAAGIYTVAYSYQNDRGQTLLSPFSTITISAGQKISVPSVSLPVGATNVNWYCSPAANSRQLRLVKQNNGAGFEINQLPRISAALPPDFNRTGAEVMRVAAVFSDREEIRSNAARSNVLKGTFEFQPERKSPVNQIELTFRDATQDFRLSRIILRDDAHIERTKKVSKLEINGQAIDSYHQAYRIAAGALAENRDADFFYKWTADREALLLEEGAVVCITDAAAGVVNFPVRIETIEINIDKGFPRIAFTARKYSTTLYDDSVSERQIPVIIETGSAASFADYEAAYQYAPTNFTETRELNALTASVKDVADVVATIMDDLQNKRK